MRNKKYSNANKQTTIPKINSYDLNMSTNNTTNNNNNAQYVTAKQHNHNRNYNKMYRANNNYKYSPNEHKLHGYTADTSDDNESYTQSDPTLNNNTISNNIAPTRGRHSTIKNYNSSNNNKLDTKSREQIPDSNQSKFESKQLKEDEEEEAIEEVYISNCCGFTCISDQSNSSGNMSQVKLLFSIFNGLVFVFALANVGMGLWFRIDPKVYEIHHYIETQNFTISGWILLFAGFVACLVSLLACSGSSKNSGKILVLYLSSMVILTLLFIGALVMLSIYGFGLTLERFLQKEIMEQMRLSSHRVESAQFIDFVQVKLACCGAWSAHDYQELGMYVPVSCLAIDKMYQSAPGCARAIREMLDVRGGLAVGFLCASILTQMVAIALSSTLFCTTLNSRNRLKTVQQTKPWN